MRKKREPAGGRGRAGVEEARPDRLLVEYAGHFPKGRALDLGCGPGRNALHLAEVGYDVTAVDSSREAVERCRLESESLGLKIEVVEADLSDFEIAKERYSLILCAWVLNFFRIEQGAALASRVKAGVAPEGLLYCAVLSTEDPGYAKARERFQRVEPNTYILPRSKSIYHFFEEKELLNHFQDLKTIYRSSGTKLDIGEGEPHYHGFIDFIGQRE